MTDKGGPAARSESGSRHGVHVNNAAVGVYNCHRTIQAINPFRQKIVNCLFHVNSKKFDTMSKQLFSIYRWIA